MVMEALWCGDTFHQQRRVIQAISVYLAPIFEVHFHLKPPFEVKKSPYP